jgi:hypothetical protein
MYPDKIFINDAIITKSALIFSKSLKRLRANKLNHKHLLIMIENRIQFAESEATTKNN